jgi:antitoxin HigA-1
MALRVSAPTVSDIVHQRRAVPSDVALRLARYFNTTPEFWLNLQTRYDLEVARDEEETTVRREVQPLRSANAR